MSSLVHRPLVATKADLERFGACFLRNGSDKPIERLRWQYLDNGLGRLFVDVAEHDGRFAAIYASLPVRMRVGTHVRLGLQSLDTLTDADHRGRGLFSSLAASLFDRARAEAQLIYGFPNAASAKGFFGKLKWSSLDPVPFLVRPLRASLVTKKLASPWLTPLNALGSLKLLAPWPSVRISDEAIFDQRITELWNAFRDPTLIGVERDAAYMRWRLKDKPNESYRHVQVFADDRLIFHASYAVKDKHGFRIGYLMELLFQPGTAGSAWHYLQTVLHGMTAEGAEVALAWCFGHSRNFPILAASGFLPLPKRLRPIELHMGVLPLQPSSVDVTRRRQWYVSYLDSDTV